MISDKRIERIDSHPQTIPNQPWYASLCESREMPLVTGMKLFIVSFCRSGELNFVHADPYSESPILGAESRDPALGGYTYRVSSLSQGHFRKRRELFLNIC